MLAELINLAILGMITIWIFKLLDRAERTTEIEDLKSLCLMALVAFIIKGLAWLII